MIRAFRLDFSEKELEFFIVIEELESTIDRMNYKVSDILHALD